MTDETKDTAREPEPPVDTVVGVVADDSGNVQAVTGVAVQGNQALMVAQFADMDSAKAAYYALVDAEAKRAIDIAAVSGRQRRLPGQGPHPEDDRPHDAQRPPVGRSSAVPSSASSSRPRSSRGASAWASPAPPWARPAT